MSHILGLKFRDSGQIYYFDSGAFVVNTFDRVIVNTDQGMALAKVVLVLDEPPEDFEGGEIKPIYRLASEEDIVQEKENEALGKEAFEYCRKCIIEHKLDMKLVDVDVFFDRCKIVFYFTAPNRIDFRELVKDLVRTYRTRIELRQIGVRHETQMTGAVGNCGQLCCCRRFLRKFAPVTIKMAKEQNLFLNPTKISGICGRLLCCLAYEQDNYEKFHAKCPRVGKRYITERGGMKVLRANFFRDSLSVLPDGGEEEEISIDEWAELEPQRPDPNQQQQPQSQQQQRSENKPRKDKDKPRKAKDVPDDEPGGADTSSEEPKAAKAKEEAQADAAEPAQAKPERKKRDPKRGRRGAKGRKRDKSDEQQGESSTNDDGDKGSESREELQETAMPAGEVVQSEKGPTNNLPAVKTKGTFGISGLGAQPAKPQQSEEEQGKAPVEEKAAKGEQKEARSEGPVAQQTGDTTTEKDAQDGSGKSKKGKGRSRSSRRRPSRRSGRGRGGGKSGGESGSASKDSGESAGSGNARASGDSKSSGSPAEAGESGGAGGSEKSGAAQRKSRPRRRRRKPKQEKPKE